jgi:hypothetical protein
MAKVCVFEKPNAQVQGRALGLAEANSGGGVPCNAQLGRCRMLVRLMSLFAFGREHMSNDCVRMAMPQPVLAF